MGEFEGKRVVVTGGAELCLVARRPEPLAAAVGELSDAAWGHACDVSDPAQVEELSLAVSSRWDRVDGLVNNAGIAPLGNLEDTSPEVWDAAFAVNARGPYLVTRALLPGLRAAGKAAVVNVSSTLAVKPITGMAAYCAAKAAVNQLTRVLALELAPRIRVNAVMPAVVDTPIHRTRGMSRDDVEGMAGFHPLRRVGKPEEIAATIVFLLSPDSAWTTGAVVPVDGGMLAT